MTLNFSIGQSDQNTGDYRLVCYSEYISLIENRKETRRCILMDTIRWEFYPHVAENPHARTWLETQMLLGLAQSTIHAYGRGANDYLQTNSYLSQYAFFVFAETNERCEVRHKFPTRAQFFQSGDNQLCWTHPGQLRRRVEAHHCEPTSTRWPRGYSIPFSSFSLTQRVIMLRRAFTNSSLGVVFMNAFQAVRERDKIKAVIFFTLTALLATVAGLITHFDALSHASGLPVTDKGVSGIIPLWVMTTLRALAVIGFLLASRLKHISFRELRLDWNKEPERNQEPPREPAVAPQIDYHALAAALVKAMQQAGAIGHVNVVEQGATALPALKAGTTMGATPEEPVAAKLERVYDAIREERMNQNNQKPISARELARRANVRRSTCSDWLQQHGAGQVEGYTAEGKLSPLESDSFEKQGGAHQEPPE